MSDLNLTMKEADDVVAGAKAPRITREIIDAALNHHVFLHSGTMTVCILVLHNGWKAVGTSAPADPANYDSDVGERYAYEDAIRQLWPLMGYALCDRLHRGDAP